MTKPLSPDVLRWTCPLDALPFETTAEIDPEEGIVGQDRATEALTFGLAFRAADQHIFVRGGDGTGRLTLVKRLLESSDKLDASSHDHVMVLDFDQLDRPALLTFPSCEGPKFKEAMATLRRWIKDDLIEEVEDLATRDGQPLQRHTKAKVDAVTKPFEASLSKAGLVLVQVVDEDGDNEPTILPVVDGEPVQLETLELAVASGEADADELKALIETIEPFNKALVSMQMELRALQREHDKQLAALVEEIAKVAMEEHTAPLIDSFPIAADFLQQVVNHTVNNLGHVSENGEEFTNLFDVNVLLTRKPGLARPVVVESAPSLQGLLGTIDTPITEGTAPHMGIFPGSILRADGGVLVLHARSVLREEGAWEALTRTLRSREIQLLPGDQPTTLRPPGIKPAPIPIDVKVVLIGDLNTWYLLDQNDPDFPNLFKILADFDEMLPITKDTLSSYAAVIAKVGLRCGKAFTRRAVAELIEQGACIAAEHGYLTTRFGRISDIAKEAAWLSTDPTVKGKNVRQAIRNARRRADGPGTLFRERVKTGAIRILTEGSAVGELNGLAVISAGPQTYGMPVRITATAGPGTKGPMNIEEEAALSGQIHVKSFHIVTGLLRRLLDLPHPVTMDASIAFEQSYGGIDGDSASAASFVVLLSAITGLPVRQDLAMTGAIDQVGTIMPIGAVSEKIEGFYECCKVRDLTGTQGVVVPKSSAGDLMLHRDVVQAARDGRFAVYSIERIEEAIELFFGLPAEQVLATARDHLTNYWHVIRPTSVRQTSGS